MSVRRVKGRNVRGLKTARWPPAARDDHLLMPQCHRKIAAAVVANSPCAVAQIRGSRMDARAARLLPAVERRPSER